jgi:hypothetical protein
MSYVLGSILLTLVACSTPSASTQQELGGIGCSVNGPDERACDPADTKKTTICHVPPGNPGNAHTLCVGNAAVPAHLGHGDFVGTCSCPDATDAGVGSNVDAGAGSGSDASTGPQ